MTMQCSFPSEKKSCNEVSRNHMQLYTGPNYQEIFIHLTGCNNYAWQQSIISRIIQISDKILSLIDHAGRDYYH